MAISISSSLWLVKLVFLHVHSSSCFLNTLYSVFEIEPDVEELLSQDKDWICAI